MSSLLSSTRNTRALPTGTLRYIRSDAPVRLSDDEIRWLLERHVKTVVDLRSEEEVLNKPCRLQFLPEFRYVHLPVTGGNSIPDTIVQLHEIYAAMVDEHMEEIIRTIMNADTNVLYFCTAGKDRTGVVSALIMRRLGFDREAIIADYMESKENLQDALEAFAKEHREVDIGILIPQAENMERLLDYLDKQ